MNNVENIESVVNKNLDETENINDVIDRISKLYELNNTMTSEFQRKINEKVSEHLSNQVINQLFPKPENKADIMINTFLNSDIGKKMGEKIPNITTKLFESVINRVSDEQINKIIDFTVNLLDDNEETESEFVSSVIEENKSIDNENNENNKNNKNNEI